MTIRRDIVQGALDWSVNAESDDRTGLVYKADPDGRDLTTPSAGRFTAEV
jgi:hypothetical protein